MYKLCTINRHTINSSTHANNPHKHWEIGLSMTKEIKEEL